jgi:hypothetical protein
MKLYEGLDQFVVTFERARNVGIYLLLRGREVVYVGQSTNMMARIGAHLAEQKKAFDGYVLLPCEPQNLTTREVEMIIMYLPEYNLTIPANQAYISILQVKELSGIGLREIKKMFREAGIVPVGTLNNPIYEAQKVRSLFQNWGAK